MRKVTYGAACSADGFITDRDGGVDWLHFSKDVQAVMAEYWSRIDTILMGRKTYEFAVAAAGAGDKGGGGEPPMAGITTYVFSRTLRSVSTPGTELVREDAGAFVAALKRKRGREICVMGGGELAQSLLRARVLDEVGMNIHPVLLGAGVPLFRDAGRVKLKLIENRTLDGGCVLATYRVLT